MSSAFKQDLKRNQGNTKGKILVSAYRLARYFHLLGKKNVALKILSIPVLALYKIFIDYLFGVYVPASAKIGGGLVIYHGVGIVIHPDTVIGENCTLRQNTTIGNKGDDNPKTPIIGNNVDIGAHAIIIGELKIGDNAKIGAGAIITKSVPDNAVAVGNPMRILSPKNTKA